jgi:type VI secretion system secreted protein Hcp
MAVDVFINMGDKIKGESKDKEQGQKGDIDVMSWSWGVQNTGTWATGGGGGAGKASFHNLTFLKQLDKATPAIWKACTTGQHIDKVVLLERKAGGKQEKQCEITMEKVLVTSAQLSGSQEIPAESVNLDFAKVKIEYFMQDDKGATSSAGVFAFDIEGHAEV